jgi:hypothetical protein
VLLVLPSSCEVNKEAVRSAPGRNLFDRLSLILASREDPTRDQLSRNTTEPTDSDPFEAVTTLEEWYSQTYTL